MGFSRQNVNYDCLLIFIRDNLVVSGGGVCGEFIGSQGLLSKYSFEIVISKMVQHFDEVTFNPWRNSFKIRRPLWVSLSPGFKIVM